MRLRRVSRTVQACIAFIVLAVAIMAAGCDDPNWETPPHYEYKANISGLSNYYSTGSVAHIMIPVPVVDGIASLPFKDALASGQYIYPGKGAWNTNFYSPGDARYIRLNRTPAGLMLDVGLNDTSVDNSNASLRNVNIDMLNILAPAGTPEANRSVNEIISRPLYPIVNDTPTPYTVWVNGKNVTNYTTYLYVDDCLKPKNSENQTININIVFGVIVGYHPYGSASTQTVYVINESIPANVTGFVPVRVQYAGTRSGYYFLDY